MNRLNKPAVEREGVQVVGTGDIKINQIGRMMRDLFLGSEIERRDVLKVGTYELAGYDDGVWERVMIGNC